jgi:hypothetical protein
MRTEILATKMLRKLKSFDEWIRTADKKTLIETCMMFGEPKAFYDRFVGELKSLVQLEAEESNGKAN